VRQNGKLALGTRFWKQKRSLVMGGVRDWRRRRGKRKPGEGVRRESTRPSVAPGCGVQRKKKGGWKDRKRKGQGGVGKGKKK